MPNLKNPKPKQHTHKYYNYHECEKYIAKKLGIKDLRDCLGKFDESNGPYEERENIEYRDFWHFIVDDVEIHNGCAFYIPEPYEGCDWKQWQIDICNAFADEFGMEQFWVSW